MAVQNILHSLTNKPHRYLANNKELSNVKHRTKYMIDNINSRVVKKYQIASINNQKLLQIHLKVPNQSNMFVL